MGKDMHGLVMEGRFKIYMTYDTKLCMRRWCGCLSSSQRGWVEDSEWSCLGLGGSLTLRWRPGKGGEP